MQSKAKLVKDYLKEVPKERKSSINKLRKLIKKSLPPGYKEVMQYGMITYVVPLSKYPQGYLGNKAVPLPYVALASQKNYMSLYLTNIYQDKSTESWFTKEYKKSGKRMDVGKSCVRFKTLDDLPLDTIAKTVALTPIQKFIASYEKNRSRR